MALGSYWNVIFGFLINILITRLLSPEAIGLFAYAAFFSQLLVLQPKLGLSYGFVQHKNTSDAALGTFIVTEALTAAGTLLIVLVAYPFLPGTIAQMAVVMALLTAAQGFVGIGGILLDRELRFRTTSVITIAAFTLSYVPAIWLAATGYGAWSLVAQQVANGMCVMGALLWLFRAQLPRFWDIRRQFSPALARYFLRYGLTIGLAMFAGSLVTTLDNFLVATFVGTTMLGFYDRGYRMAQWPGLLFNGVLSRTAFYTYVQIQNDLPRIQKAMQMVIWLITTLAFPIALALFIAAPDLITLLYGERWLPSAQFLRLLVIIFAARPLWENANTVLVATGDARTPTLITFAWLLTLAITGIPLTLAWGALGTCLAVALGTGVAVILIYRRLLSRIPFPLLTSLAPPLLACALTIAGYVVLSRMTELNSLHLALRTMLKGLYAVGAFLLWTFLLQPHIARERLAYVWGLASGK